MSAHMVYRTDLVGKHSFDVQIKSKTSLSKKGLKCRKDRLIKRSSFHATANSSCQWLITLEHREVNLIEWRHFLQKPGYINDQSVVL